jgi:hypothetical protein
LDSISAKPEITPPSVVLERVTRKPDPEDENCTILQNVPEYRVRHIERFPLGTLYPTIVDEIEQLLQERPLLGRTRLVLDATGVGAPIADTFLHRGLNPVPIYITGADRISYARRSIRVPKRQLVSVLQLLFQSKRLKIAAGLPLRQVLVAELLNFTAKITAAANDTYEAWREGQHDDLVLALALACWYFERAARSLPQVRAVDIGPEPRPFRPAPAHVEVPRSPEAARVPAAG